MKNLVVTFMIFITATTAVLAQGQSTPSVPPPSTFNLDELFNLDLDELFYGLQEELNLSRDVWGQYIDPSLIDSSLLRMGDIDFGSSFDTLFQQLDMFMNESEGFGGMLDQLLKNFNLPLNTNPLNQDILPKDFDEEGWDIIPNSPPQKSQKKGVSEI